MERRRFGTPLPAYSHIRTVANHWPPVYHRIPCKGPSGVHKTPWLDLGLRVHPNKGEY